MNEEVEMQQAWKSVTRSAEEEEEEEEEKGKNCITVYSSSFVIKYLMMNVTAERERLIHKFEPYIWIYR